MQNSDFIKKLKKESENNIPDPYSKIVAVAEAENLLPPDKQNYDVDFVVGHNNSAVRVADKRRFVTVLAFIAAALIICTAIVLPVALKNRENFQIGPSSVQLSTDDVYGIGAVSTAKLLELNSSISAAKSAANETLPDDPAIAQVTAFNRYYVAFDSFFGKDVVKTETKDNHNHSYPFEKQMDIQGMNLDGSAVNYKMYYTEILNKNEVDDDKTESEYLLTGIMLIDGTEYFIEGERSYEQDEEESENELKIRAYKDLTDKKNYIEMEQESSVEDNETETEYVYSVYRNDKLIEQTALKLETERKDNKEQTEYELEFRKGDAKGKYKITREVKNGKTNVKVKYDIDSEKGEFTVRELTENGKEKNEFTFENGTVISIVK